MRTFRDSATLVVGGLALALAGGTICALVFSHPGGTNHEVTYSDFIVIMLTAVTLLVALLAIILAILAYIGWSTISEKVASESSKYLRDGFKDGGSLHQMFRREFRLVNASLMYEGMKKGADTEFDDDARAEFDGEQNE